MRFEWDEAKNRSNTLKYGVAFEDTRLLFESGQDYLEIFDETHSHDEDRFLAIGPVSGRILVVSWRESEEGTVRIISARPAVRREKQHY